MWLITLFVVITTLVVGLFLLDWFVWKRVRQPNPPLWVLKVNKVLQKI